MTKLSETSALLSESGPAVTKRRWREFKDRLFGYTMGVGGVSVIIAILLIFFYLLYAVLPLFKPAGATALASYPVPGGSGEKTLHVTLDEQAEISARFTASGRVVFFRAADGAVLREDAPALPADVAVTSFAAGNPAQDFVAYGLSDGRVIVLQPAYSVTYTDDGRVTTPHLEYPLGPEPIVVDETGNRAVTALAVQVAEDSVSVVAVLSDEEALLVRITKETSFLDGEVTLERTQAVLPRSPRRVTHILLDDEQRNLYLADAGGVVRHFNIAGAEPELIESVRVVDEGAGIASLDFLTGSVSLLVGSARGEISQWFPVRNERNDQALTRIRSFSLKGATISQVAPEHGRKGFLVADMSGRVGIYHATSQRTLRVVRVAKTALTHLAVAPRADAMLALDDRGGVHFWRIENEHPEVSWSALWGKVWYEGYPEPRHIWQSSAATNDFEPKFSLTPLTFGTLKAAFYAMVLAMPLAIMGAIFTAYFMAPAMRNFVKPTIEIMGALPTVMLGFLAGLWLAPLVEVNLPGIFALLIFLPFGILGVGYAWHRLPEGVRHKVPDGWQAALLVPVVLLLIYVSMVLSGPLEAWLFGGDMRQWLTHEMGIGFDQRNALVVGLAMGFAVIPTIFSISEDAIFNVPRHLTNGSLALGATPWQTLVRVVLLTASPGIFSAVMIGLGRAVGETMIVLMATGNTPIMDMNIFQGFRALSANIAVEMPESEVNSTHYRILFLAAFVLFMFTFIVNTLAELVQQRLRKKYSSL